MLIIWIIILDSQRAASLRERLVTAATGAVPPAPAARQVHAAWQCAWWHRDWCGRQYASIYRWKSKSLVLFIWKDLLCELWLKFNTTKRLVIDFLEYSPDKNYRVTIHSGKLRYILVIFGFAWCNFDPLWRTWDSLFMWFVAGRLIS